MISKKLYGLAYAFANLKLWEKLHDSQVFAFTLKNGQRAYCSVLGYNKEVYALNVYVGEDGWDSLLDLYLKSARELSLMEHNELLASQDCIQLCFDEEMFMEQKEVAEAKAYARENNATLPLRRCLPHFLRFRKYYNVSALKAGEDKKILEEVLEYIIAFEKQKGFESLELRNFDDGFKAKLLEKSGSAFSEKEIDLAQEVKEVPDYVFDESLEEIKRLPRKGRWCVEVTLMPKAVKIKGGDERYAYLMIVIIDDGYTMLVPPSFDLGEMAYSFAERMAGGENAPEEIYVRNQRTESQLKDLCAKTGIKLIRKEDIPFVDGFYNDFVMMDNDREEEEYEPPYQEETGTAGPGVSIGIDRNVDKMMGGIIDMVNNLNMDELRKLPPDMLKSLKGMVGLHVLPGELEMKLANL